MNVGLGYGLMSVMIVCWTKGEGMDMKAGLWHGLMSGVTACWTNDGGVT